MSEKKVLIITYYWPPSGGSGVQRWLKFVKYLPQFGWTPYVFTPENPSFDIRDESLLNDVPMEAEIIKMPIWEPYQLFQTLSKLFTGKSRAAKPNELISANDTSFFQKISIWIRANLFMPDPRVFWVRPSVNFLHDFIIDNKIKNVITTGPPHSIHLIGLRLKKRNPAIKWIADFRDPWSEWGFLQSFPLLPVTKWAIRRLERRVLQAADEVITVTPSWVQMFTRLGQRPVKLITNGFDEDDFKNFKRVKSEKFVICHVGIVNEQCNPLPFMHAIAALLLTKPELAADVCIRFVGDVKQSFKNEVNANNALRGVTEFIDRVSHDKVMEYYQSASVLLLILTGYKEPESYLPGKVFEYIRVGAPILGVGPIDGDADYVLRDSKAGEMIEDQNGRHIEEFILKHYTMWRSDKIHSPSESNGQYSRAVLTQQLTAFI
jgi:glycosyltransferase involved in cell wall biosynthesis